MTKLKAIEQLMNGHHVEKEELEKLLPTLDQLKLDIYARTAQSHYVKYITYGMPNFSHFTSEEEAQRIASGLMELGHVSSATVLRREA